MEHSENGEAGFDDTEQQTFDLLRDVIFRQHCEEAVDEVRRETDGERKAA
jgi:hypothetical protein